MLLLKPILDLQSKLSVIPNKDQFLIEYFQTKEGFSFSDVSF